MTYYTYRLSARQRQLLTSRIATLHTSDLVEVLARHVSSYDDGMMADLLVDVTRSNDSWRLYQDKKTFAIQLVRDELNKRLPKGKK